MKVSRRTFLKFAGVSALGAGIIRGPLWRPPPLQALAEEETPLTLGAERWVPTVCLQCDAGCGLKVRVVDGRAVKIEGNPGYPTNQGALCPRGQAGLQVLYDPDRIKTPLKRHGGRGEGAWLRIGWPEALELVAQRLRELREAGQAHTVAFLSGRHRGHMQALIARFLEAYGSPNDIGLDYSYCQPSVLARYLTEGFREPPAYDLANTNYLLSFGASFAESWTPPVEILRLYGHMRRGRPGVRPKIVQVDTRLSLSAAKADEWVPVNPGTEGALALGLAHVIIEEGRYDQRFLAQSTFGFEDWTDDQGQPHEGFKTLVLKRYSPAWASQVTGVPAETIARLAREFASHRPALAVGGHGSGEYTNSLSNMVAIHCLNALVGSISVPGGTLPRKVLPFAQLPPVERDQVAERGLAMPRLDRAGTARFPFASSVSPALAGSLLEEDPYRLNALFLYNANPVHSLPGGERLRAALEKVPLIVSFSPFLDESAEMADLILPDHTYLEKLQDYAIPTNAVLPIIGLLQPVVTPLYDTAHTGDVLIAIARKLGGAVARAFPWSGFTEMLQESVVRLYQGEDHPAQPGGPREFWDNLLENGGWWDETSTGAVGEPGFATPSGRFELYSQTARQALENLVREEVRRNGTTLDHEINKALGQLGVKARGDEGFLPHYEPPRFAGDERQYPFYLNIFRPLTLLEGTGANQPWLLEIYGAHQHRGWDSWLEINPDIARKLGIRDGDDVWVESPAGRIKVTARMYPGALPQVVNMPLGLGHQASGRWARNTGASPAQIVGSDLDRLGGLAAWLSTRVRVYRA